MSIYEHLRFKILRFYSPGYETRSCRSLLTKWGATEKEVLQTDTADEDKDLDLDATIYITSM